VGSEQACPGCGAFAGDGEPYKTDTGHFYINDAPCPYDTVTEEDRLRARVAELERFPKLVATLPCRCGRKLVDCLCPGCLKLPDDNCTCADVETCLHDAEARERALQAKASAFDRLRSTFWEFADPTTVPAEQCLAILGEMIGEWERANPEATEPGAHPGPVGSTKEQP